MIIPEHLQIETINGVCSAHCSMCTIDSWRRPKHIMSQSIFEKIVDKFIKYRNHLKFVTLHGCGEPLLDKELPKKISYLKEKGFVGTGFASNCTHLEGEMAEGLLESKLDTIICSIDGTTKEVHESIRCGTDFDMVKSNVLNFISLRNAKQSKSRILLRFIRQKSNEHQWEDYTKYWNSLLDNNIGDGVLKFDVHNWGGELDDYNLKDINQTVNTEPLICEDLFIRLLIYSNGEIGFCCADDNGFFKLGNAIYEDPIAVYNNGRFNYYRKMMMEGRIGELKHCCSCSIPRSRFLKNK